MGSAVAQPPKTTQGVCRRTAVCSIGVRLCVCLEGDCCQGCLRQARWEGVAGVQEGEGQLVANAIARVTGERARTVRLPAGCVALQLQLQLQLHAHVCLGSGAVPRHCR